MLESWDGWDFSKRSDCKLLEHYMPKRWKLSKQLKKELILKLTQALDECKNVRQKCSVAKILAILEGQNQVDDLTREKYERLDQDKKVGDDTIVVKLGNKTIKE